MNKKRIFSLVAATMLSVSVLAGCGSDSKLKDGTYAVETGYDKHGYKSSFSMEVKDGKIATVNYDEIMEDGTSKKADDAYNEKMMSIMNTNAQTAYPALEKSLLDKQSADVDAVAGASQTTEAFKKVAAKAIENAQAGNTEKAIVE